MSATYNATELMPDGVHPSSLGYVADPTRLSPNGAKKLLPPSTPAKFDYYRTHPQKPKRVWDFGLVAHKLVLNEGDQFVVLHPEIHGLKKDGEVAENPRATATWKEAEARTRLEGLTPIHSEDYAKALEMAQKVHEHETAGPLLAKGDAEQWFYWHDAQSGQGLRQRLDWVTHDNGRLTIVEYKTAADASREAFERQAFKLGYFVAAAFAVSGIEKLKPGSNPEYLFIAQEKEPPYDLAVYPPDDDAMQYGQRQMQRAIEIYRQCTESDTWPGYPPGKTPISVPLWAIDDEMEIPA